MGLDKIKTAPQFDLTQGFPRDILKLVLAQCILAGGPYEGTLSFVLLYLCITA